MQGNTVVVNYQKAYYKCEATLAFASNLVPYNNGYDFPEQHVFSKTMGKKSQEKLEWGSGDTGSWETR